MVSDQNCSLFWLKCQKATEDRLVGVDHPQPYVYIGVEMVPTSISSLVPGCIIVKHIHCKNISGKIQLYKPKRLKKQKSWFFIDYFKQRFHVCTEQYISFWLEKHFFDSAGGQVSRQVAWEWSDTVNIRQCSGQV